MTIQKIKTINNIAQKVAELKKRGDKSKYQWLDENAKEEDVRAGEIRATCKIRMVKLSDTLEEIEDRKIINKVLSKVGYNINYSISRNAIDQINMEALRIIDKELEKKVEEKRIRENR